MKKILILMIALFLVSSVNAIDIYDCQVIDEGNMVYRLQRNIQTSGTCFTIQADNVLLNLNKHRALS